MTDILLKDSKVATPSTPFISKNTWTCFINLWYKFYLSYRSTLLTCRHGQKLYPFSISLVISLGISNHWMLFTQCTPQCSINIRGTIVCPGIYIKFRQKSFHMRNGFWVPRSIWAPLLTPNRTLYLHFCKYLLVEVTVLRSQTWTLCLDSNDEMRHSIHSSVDTDLKSAQDLISWDVEHLHLAPRWKLAFSTASSS